jgi:hypothetical protein
MRKDTLPNDTYFNAHFLVFENLQQFAEQVRTGLHPTTFTYSLEKWASKAALEKLVGKFFTRSPPVNTGLTMAEYW